MEASQAVAELSKELAVKEKELAIASEKAEVVLKQVTVQVSWQNKFKIFILNNKKSHSQTFIFVYNVLLNFFILKTYQFFSVE